MVIDRRNKIHKEFLDLYELKKKLSYSSLFIQKDIDDIFSDKLNFLQEHLDLIDWILNK